MSLTLFFMMSGVIIAQNGSISGVIKDESGGLPFVLVVLENTMYSSTTDFNGKFTIANVEPGVYTLESTYVGYEGLKQEVTVLAGQNTNLGEIMMSNSSVSIGTVEVGNLKKGQMTAINIQKKSSNIVSVISASGIGKLPDRNAAEAVQRVAGVTIERDQGEGRYVIVRGTPAQWSSTLINNDRMPSSDRSSRAVPLDIFPSDFINYVEVSKALTADMEGDAIGGSVNFVTKTAPEDTTLDINLATGIHGQSMSRIVNGSIAYGARSQDDKFGYLVGVSLWDRDWGSENYEVVYDNNATAEAIKNETIDEKDGLARELQLRDYLGNRRTAGFNGAAEYNFTDNSMMYVRGILTDFRDDEVRRRQRYRFSNGRVEQAVTHTIYHTRLFGGEIGGEQTNENGVKADYKMSYYKNKFWYDSPTSAGDVKSDTSGGYFYTTWRQSGIQFNDLSDDGLFVITKNNYLNPQPNVSALTPVSTDQMLFTNAISSGRLIYEQDYNGLFNLYVPVNNVWDLKFGGKVKLKSRENFRKVVTWSDNTGTDYSVSQFSEEFPNPSGGFLLAADANYDNQLLDHVSVKNSDEMVNLNGMGRTVNYRPMDYYAASEDVYATYGMTNIKLSKTTSMVAGVRYERTNATYRANKEVEDTSGNVTRNLVEGSNIYHSVLPSFHLKWSPKDQYNVRLAVTRGMARPNYNDLVPVTNQDLGNNTISSGNPELRPTYAINYDLLGEYFFKNVGLLQAGIFYKDITDYIFERTNQQQIGDQNWVVTTPENASSATLFGSEVAIIKRLDFLPGSWSGLGVDFNYTFTNSQVEISREDEEGNEVTYTQNLPQQTDHSFNSALFYEKFGLTLRAAAHYKGAFVAEIQGPSPDHDRIYDTNVQLDFSGAYNINKKWKVFMELNNLLNSPLRYYNGNTYRPEQTEFYAVRGQIGVKYSPFAK